MVEDISPSPVGEILDQVFSRLGIDNKLRQLRVLKSWDEIVGKTLAQHSCPVAIRKGNLFVKVDSSPWLAQITYFKEKIISEFNRREGEKVIQDIYLRLGKIHARKRKRRSSPSLRNIHLDQEDLEWIERTVERIKDKHLKRALRRVLIKDRKLKKRGLST